MISLRAPCIRSEHILYRRISLTDLASAHFIITFGLGVSAADNTPRSISDEYRSGIVMVTELIVSSRDLDIDRLPYARFTIHMGLICKAPSAPIRSIHFQTVSSTGHPPARGV